MRIVMVIIIIIIIIIIIRAKKGRLDGGTLTNLPVKDK